MNSAEHPGNFIRKSVIPADVSVKRAAELMGVGRPALSDLLNGKASLSLEMAARLSKAFGADRELLLKKQVEYEKHNSLQFEKALAVRTYAPPFLDITADQISAWASKIESRSLLAVLLRKLVLSTCASISKLDFPAFENSQREGWDGRLETDMAIPWVPAGKSCWEFGCNKDPQQKANDDYASRLKSIPAKERMQTTFIFVTPHNWPGKAAWVAAKNKDKRWKAVVALDAGDLEAWLGQSVPAQNWMSERLGNNTPDLRSLDECWNLWAKVTKPELSKKLFSSSVSAFAGKLQTWLKSEPTTPFIVTSNSEEESLAFLATVLEHSDSQVENYADKAVVLRSETALHKATKSSSQFIAILSGAEVEAASAGLHMRQHTIIVRAQNAIDKDADIALDLIDDETFRAGLSAMGVSEDDARVLSRASGQSLTILRRRLSQVPEIQIPPWAADVTLGRKLIPMGLVGVWDTRSKEDQEILRYMTGDTNEATEQHVAALCRIEQSPLWAIGRYRGVSSKLDVLYAVRQLITADDLRNFFLTARIVLSERDPALDLPAEQRSWASLYGKSRNHSSAIRQGMCETLVILAVHGKNLFGSRLDLNIETEVSRTVRELLSPTSPEIWASQKNDLQAYAEAAPDMFLQILEADIKSDAPDVFSLLQPASSDMFGGGCPRSGMLWSLELLAWSPDYFRRVVEILAQLSAIKIDDNWTNKPEATLNSIFRAWMPQTSADVDTRCTVIEILCRRYPSIGWRLCLKQIEGGGQVGHYNHRPAWRNYAAGFGQPVSRSEALKFMRKALELAIEWSNHDEGTLGDLLTSIYSLEDADQARIWDKVDSWIDTSPTDEQKAILRECVRRNCFTRRAARHKGKNTSSDDRAQTTYKKLIPADVVIRHKWLFVNSWIEESLEEIEDIKEDRYDYEKRTARVKSARSAAIEEVWNARGFDGIMLLCESGDGSPQIGEIIATAELKGLNKVELMSKLATTETSFKRRLNGCVAGFLCTLSDENRSSFLQSVIKEIKKSCGLLAEEIILNFLTCAPFRRTTWAVVDELPNSISDKYWATVQTYNAFFRDEAELVEAVDRLLLVKRPAAAFACARLYPEKVDSKRLTRLMKELATTAPSEFDKIQFQPYDIAHAFDVFDKRGDVHADELAHLEFLFLSALEYEPRGIPNLERQIADSPALFVQAVGLLYRRNDGGTDPAEWIAHSEEAQQLLGNQAYRLLHNVKRIPGDTGKGSIEEEKLRKWLTEVRSQCLHFGRVDVGDSAIGELLSKSPLGNDGIWPAVEIRNALEDFGSERMTQGMAIGLYNQRGAHFREVDSREERSLSAKYRSWSAQVAAEWPVTARLLMDIAKNYESDVEWYNTDAMVRKRLPY